MKILLFDTETTGLPKSRIISPDTLHLWPHIVQFSYVIYDTESVDLQISDYVVKVPDNIIICEEAINIHGITNEMSKNGTELISVFEKFFSDIVNVDQLVAHNVDFDVNVIRIELLRLINNDNYSRDTKKTLKAHLSEITASTKLFCTMQETIEFCNIIIVNRNGYPYKKFPKLGELHEKLFDQTAKNLHNSLNDVLVTLRCYIKIKFNVDVLDVSTEIKQLFENLL